MAGENPRAVRKESLRQQVVRNIRNQIDAGVLRHGQALRSTRELAEEWGVSVFTINEAMQDLVKDGVVVAKSRSGRIVHAPDQAEHHEMRTATPHVLLIGGYAGSGKTELGRILARETGWPMLDKDTLTRPVVEAALELLGSSPNDRESESYLAKVRPREYEALVNAMTENVQCGNSAIVTAPFIKEFKDTAWLNRIAASCADLNATVTVVWVHCDADTMNTYIRHRGAARDMSKLEDWSAYLNVIDVDFRPPVQHEVINNSASGAPLQAQARDLIYRITQPT
ncbi:GntR family transcriptional regulator [Lentzea flaviverrucosa]|uniref:Regulatory protein, gntR family n=1 Tax=Lentzea flaviverrucosa TaxID=200379 RepID=A0A1H9XKF6_9PSEU|nr:GntR family transcriptional regulator [Lentzea flaviverrucosa]RDI20340.1 regulatory GntR family protein [Lentzea flaviverrucosa]SES46655.1 regulatory protein, gntR family [Lentzea flaviverrucosa]